MKRKISQKLKKELPGLKRNISLKNYTTFKIGGPAKYFFVAKNKEDLIEAIKKAKELKLPFFILGGGSNLLVSDKGFDGLVIKILNSKFYILNSKIFTEAGTPLTLIVNEAAKKGLTGLEWAAGIPGTVGGAIYGNAGAFGRSMKDVVKEVEYGEVGFPSEIRLLKIKNRDCEFSYKDSIFKHKKNLIILSAILQLKKGNKKVIESKIKKNLEQRKKTQPLNFPSAGSIFKNPPGFSAGELIEKCGLKGKKIGGVKISEKHANFILNLGRHPPATQGKAKDVIKLINLIKQKVKNKFKVNLEEEIQILE